MYFNRERIFVHIYASNFQPVVTIIQEGKMIDFYSIILNRSQKEYGNRKGVSNHFKNFKIFSHYTMTPTIINLYRP